MANTANITDEELDSKSEKKTEFTSTSQRINSLWRARKNMYPWMPISKPPVIEPTIPVAADWIVTMVTPVDKIYQMYEEDIQRNGLSRETCCWILSN